MGIAFTCVAAVLAWRLLAGGLTAYERTKRSMFLQLPEWWGYAIGVVAMLLWIVVCAWTAYESLRRARSR
jgi:TRAP-type C4-dicarboxylate transport system permease small subunit